MRRGWRISRFVHSFSSFLSLGSSNVIADVLRSGLADSLLLEPSSSSLGLFSLSHPYYTHVPRLLFSSLLSLYHFARPTAVSILLSLLVFSSSFRILSHHSQRLSSHFLVSISSLSLSCISLSLVSRSVVSQMAQVSNELEGREGKKDERTSTRGEFLVPYIIHHLACALLRNLIPNTFPLSRLFPSQRRNSPFYSG